MTVYFKALFSCTMRFRPGGYNSMGSRAGRLIAAIIAISRRDFSYLLLFDWWGMSRTAIALDEAY
jgi:hypothetical protein